MRSHTETRYICLGFHCDQQQSYQFASPPKVSNTLSLLSKSLMVDGWRFGGSQVLLEQTLEAQEFEPLFGSLKIHIVSSCHQTFGNFDVDV